MYYSNLPHFKFKRQAKQIDIGSGLYYELTEDEDGLGDDRKKRPRTAFTAAQIKALESEFEKNKYLSVSKRMQLSKQLKLTETQVGVPPTVLRPGKT